MKRNKIIPTVFSFAIVAIVAAVCGCGHRGAAGPSEGNYIRPIVIRTCEHPTGDNAPPDHRSLAAMVVAMNAARYQIYQISTTDFKIFTDFKDSRGIAMAWEAQIYSDGSASLSLPSTTPLQNSRALATIERHGVKLGRLFDRFKCQRFEILKNKAAAAGYVL